MVPELKDPYQGKPLSYEPEKPKQRTYQPATIPAQPQQSTISGVADDITKNLQSSITKLSSMLRKGEKVFTNFVNSNKNYLLNQYQASPKY